jgi:hypothetical protein
MRLVRSHLENGRLHLVRDAPAFRHPAYVVYPTDGESDLIEGAVAIMRRIVADEAGAEV